MSDFRIAPLTQSSVLLIYSERESIQTDPVYQRQGDVWPLDKRQLLIDSVLNSFDIPKIYFHAFVPPKSTDDGRVYEYAIIDGKQRREAIWAFIDGDFALDSSFKYLHDSTVSAGDLTYAELAKRYPRLKNRFDSTSLAIITIQTDDI